MPKPDASPAYIDQLRASQPAYLELRIDLSRGALAKVAQAIAFFLSETVETDGCTEEELAELLNTKNVCENLLQGPRPQAKERMPVCPTPQKRKYSNDAHAGHDAKRWSMHPYSCICGYVHLSKQSPDEHAAKINSPAASADEFPTTLEDFLK